MFVYRGQVLVLAVFVTVLNDNNNNDSNNNDNNNNDNNHDNNNNDSNNNDNGLASACRQ